MPISLTCACGALLEIDEKFVGQTIPCPDCRRPVSTRPEAPAAKATCPLAVLSLLLSLGGAFTLLGSAAGVVCGAFSLKRQQAMPELGGRGLAIAGIVMGGCATLLTLALFVLPSVLGVDSMLRQYTFGEDIVYSNDLVAVGKDEDRLNFKVSMKLPNRSWGLVKKAAAGSDETAPWEMAVASLWDDAQVVCILVPPEEVGRLPLPVDALHEFVKSRFIKWLNHNQVKKYEIGDKGLKLEDVREQKEEIGDVSYFRTSLVAGGAERHFKFRVFARGNKVFITAGGTRTRRFSSMEGELDAILKSIDTAN
jgi:hypothetical protein